MEEKHDIVVPVFAMGLRFFWRKIKQMTRLGNKLLGALYG